MTDEPQATDAKPETEDARRKSNYIKAGIGLGIGSAAIAAALLYTNSAKKKKATDTPAHPQDAQPTD
jgi:homoserine kinase